MNKYSMKVSDIVDGDTVKGDLIAEDLGIIFPAQKFRFIWVNTPERNQPGYYDAKEFTAQHLQDKTVPISLYSRDSFGRWLVAVHISEEITLNEMLLKEGLAVPFTK